MREVDVDSLLARREGGGLDVDSFVTVAPPRGSRDTKATRGDCFRDEPHYACGMNLPDQKCADDLQQQGVYGGGENAATKVETRRAEAAAAAATTREDYVTLPRQEFEALINRVNILDEKVDGSLRVKADDSRLMKILEDMVKALLVGNIPELNRYSSTAQPPLNNQPEKDNLELVELVNLDGSKTLEKEIPEGEFSEEDSLSSSEWHAPYGESIYSLIYLCAFRSQGFWYSLLVYILQILTISLAITDSVDPEAENNPLQVPAMVDPAVTYAQGVTIFLLFAYQSDMIEAILKLGDGFSPLEGHVGATFSTWLFSCLAQLVAGLLVLLGCFILTMQASTVIDLMLNLTALLFISEIDDLGFKVAHYGFVTNVLQADTNAVVDIQVPKRKSRNINRRLIYVLVMATLLSGYGVLKDRQLSGHYLFTNIYEQFGDAYNAFIPYYSSILTATKERTSSHREYRDLGTSTILLAYCPVERVWTFSEGEAANPCDDYFAKSYETATYDVTSIPDSGWRVKDTNGRLIASVWWNMTAALAFAKASVDQIAYVYAPMTNLDWTQKIPDAAR